MRLGFDRPDTSGGPIAWMVRNKVTPNLLMIFLIAGGLFMTRQIKQEVFPEFELDLINIKLIYPGASPEDVEQGAIIAIEEAIRGISNIKEVRSNAGEGTGGVVLELEEGSDIMRVYLEVRQAVDAVTSLPADLERIDVSPATRRREVLDLQIYGDLSERALRAVVEDVRDRLLVHESISVMELEGARDVELHIELPEHVQRAYGLTIADVAQKVAAASIDLPGGKLETRGGQILLRVKDRRDWAQQFARIPIVQTRDGAVRRLGELADIKESFEETTREGYYKGVRSATLEIYRVGDQTPIEVSDAVREVMADIEPSIPNGVAWEINRDRSDMFRQRLELLLKNAFIGLVLVFLLLALFLELRLAFWVTMGIPTAFLGGMLFLPWVDVSLNMISMFAFIVALGIVVDDAIVAGENIYEMRARGMSWSDAAIAGAKGVSLPIGFAILTNIVCFMPLLFVPGFLGKIWQVIPMVVITTFLVSWVECLLILPGHLGHKEGAQERKPWLWSPFSELRRLASAGLQWTIFKVYTPSLRLMLRWRFTTLAVGSATVILVWSAVVGGRIGRTMFPRVESDVSVATAILPVGTPAERSRKVAKELVEAVQGVAKANGGDKLLVGAFARIKDNDIQVRAYLQPPGVRPISTAAFTKKWRKASGDIAGLQSLKFQSDRGGPGSGASIQVELAHRDIATLDRASAALAERLLVFPKVKDVDDGYARGKSQLNVKLTPDGEALGLTSQAVARQIRGAFYGALAVRQQRGRNELTVLVRRPQGERASEFDVRQLLIATPAGTRVPLKEVATIDKGRAFTVINRRDGRRTVTVGADVVPIGETPQIKAELDERILPALAEDFPGLTYGYQGRQRRFAEGIGALANGFLVAMIVIYFLLAIPFRSYVQPIIVMIAIPFGLAGAVMGHMVLGYNLSILSMMGGVALSGVVVNDSLVLVEYANRLRREEGLSAFDAAMGAAQRRFRPVILTTLTTFLGMAPMIFETSRQAKFLIPMAIALGFGIVFATVVTLVIVPALYTLVDDAKTLVERLRGHAPSPPVELQPGS